MCAVLYQKNQQPALVRAQSDAGAKTKRMVRRASSGDHAFLPNRQEREAVRQANTAFGVDKNHAQDRVVRLARTLLKPDPGAASYLRCMDADIMSHLLGRLGARRVTVCPPHAVTEPRDAEALCKSTSRREHAVRPGR